MQVSLDKSNQKTKNKIEKIDKSDNKKMFDLEDLNYIEEN